MIQKIFKNTHQNFVYNQYINYIHKLYNDATKTKLRGARVLVKKSNDLNNNNINNESNGKSNKRNN